MKKIKLIALALTLGLGAGVAQAEVINVGTISAGTTFNSSDESVLYRFNLLAPTTLSFSALGVTHIDLNQVLNGNYEDGTSGNFAWQTHDNTGPTFEILNFAAVKGFYQVNLSKASDAKSIAGSISIAAVPEPETYAMMLAGLGLIGFSARRRKTQA